jgi:hypothetical protein
MSVITSIHACMLHNKNRPGWGYKYTPPSMQHLQKKKHIQTTFARSSFLFSICLFFPVRTCMYPKQQLDIPCMLLLFFFLISLVTVDSCMSIGIPLCKDDFFWVATICLWHRGKRHEFSRVQRLFWHCLGLSSPFSLNDHQSIRVCVGAKE